MKVAILGPVTTENYFGGVASFDESLSDSFQSFGWKSRIYSFQEEKPSNNRLKIINIKKTKISNFINEWKPDLIISSLQYGTILKDIKFGKKVYFLHGFFNFQSYGVLKTLAATYLTKRIINNADFVIANSCFTATINQRLWNIQVDGIATLGIDKDFQNKVFNFGHLNNNGSHKILFVGRLAVSKHLERVIEACSKLKINYELIVAGDGPQKNYLKKYATELDVNVKFIGRIKHENLFDIYQSADVFISLSESEPFGITYVEALLAGCKIVCPITGGQVEYLSKYLDRCQFVDPFNIIEVVNGIQTLFSKNVSKLDSKDIEKFNYKNTADKILKISKLIEG